MNEVEKIKRYIKRERLGLSVRYDMSMNECMAMSKQICDGTMGRLEVIALAFDYGRAKGYRAAKAEAAQ